MKKIKIIVLLSTLILLVALGGCENVEAPQCKNVIELTYIDGYTETVNYQCDCIHDIYQYENQTKAGFLVIAYNTIRFKLISKTVLNK
jgi:hypothetical protein